MKNVRDQGLTAAILRKYADDNINSRHNFFCTRLLQDTEGAEPDQLRQLQPLLVELCKNISSKTLESSGTDQEDFTEDRVDEIVRQHLVEIGYHFTVWRYYPWGKIWEPEPANQAFLNAPRPITTLSAINDWSSGSETPSSLKSLSQNSLMNSIRQSLVGAKASAAFCCGGSVAFSDVGLQPPTNQYAEMGPVTLRWDGKQSIAGKLVFSQASSGDPQFYKALEQLCDASELASFGRGGETVFDGKRSNLH